MSQNFERTQMKSTTFRTFGDARAMSSTAALMSMAGVLLLSACANTQEPIIPAKLDLPVRQDLQSAAPVARAAESLRVQELPSIPQDSTKAAPAPAPAATPGLDASAPSAINIEQIVLGSFAQMVYAEVLKKNVSVDPRVLARRDLVTFRTGGAQTAAQIEQAVKLLLKSYGVAVIDAGGLVRVVPDDASGATFPEIRRGAATPETPLPLRPVYHLIDIQVVRPGEVSGWLRTIFGDRIKVQEDPGRNALLISGNPDNVTAALEAIRALDQPVMQGRTSVSLTPAYWSAEDLARRLFEVLSAEGYAVQPLSTGAVAGNRAPIILLPVAALNSVFVFANSDALVKHVQEWAARLDRPNERGIGKNYFIYPVKHKDASALAVTLEQLLSGTKASAPSAGGQNAAAATPARGSSVVVDSASNTLIFQANPDEYSQLTALLQTLDRPVKSAMIEVTVAELSVDKNSQLGVEWFFNQTASDGSTAIGQTLGGLAIGTSGFNYQIIGSAGGAARLKLNALASDNKATILSSPRVTARNGEQAMIQVGQEVPIITSQQSTTSVNAGVNLGPLQAIQYKSTGVILKVRPAIHSGDQIDLEVQQEVSAAVATNTGVNNSPTISTRKLDTKLSLKSGSTVMLGGLISDETSDGAAGIPLLKDIPLVGSLFRSQNTGGKRRELIVLITPYVINDQHDAEAITDAFRRNLGPWARPVMTAPAPLAPTAVPPPAVPKVSVPAAGPQQ